jgi:hypothetical protein
MGLQHLLEALQLRFCLKLQMRLPLGGLLETVSLGPCHIHLLKTQKQLPRNDKTLDTASPRFARPS